MRAARFSRTLGLCGLMLAATGLSGCVAALPLAASGMLAKRTVEDKGEAEVAVPEEVAVVMPAPNLTEKWFAAALFAGDRAGTGLSVLPDPAASNDDEPVLPCHGGKPAILIDLDPGNAAFQPDAGPFVAQPGLAPALATARAAGTEVLWISVLGEAREADLRAVLADTGLDPAGEDTVLLIRDPAETKTQRRNAIAGEWCITAIVGDRRGDFDEFMDYLRDPDAPTPFDPLLGSGWFELPPPIKAAA